MKTVQFKKISGTMPMLILFAGKNLQETYFKSEKTMHFHALLPPNNTYFRNFGAFRIMETELSS